MKYILFFDEIGIADIGKVGGKNASLGEMYCQLTQKGINVPLGFALTADAYRLFCKYNLIEEALNALLQSLNPSDFSNLNKVGEQSRNLILSGTLPEEVLVEVNEAYGKLADKCGLEVVDVAVRSSATAEDLPSASFAGRMESYLNVSGEELLKDAIIRCYASLFTDRAIKYRYDMGFTGLDIAISVGIQQMVRSDKACSGVAFTIDPDTGFKNAIIINSGWGLGENIVQGRITPDEWIVFKPSLLNKERNPVIRKQCGRKEFTMIYEEKSAGESLDATVKNELTPLEDQMRYSLDLDEVIQLSRWCYEIEQHYGRPMDIEWAKDGLTKRMFIVQARPETVHGKEKRKVKEIYQLKQKGNILVKGIALGDKIVSGKARIIFSPTDGDQLLPGEILVTDITNPDWDPVLKKAAGIITNKGGRTSHAAIVAREMGTVAVVGCGDATSVIKSGQEITISCAEGKDGFVYDGQLQWKITEQDYSALILPNIKPMFILADPDRAFALSSFPNQGVGLMRLEFAISNSICVHPLALIHPDKVTDVETSDKIKERIRDFPDGKSYFVEKLADAVSIVAAAFYPKDVVVRMSDFKSNEYANLLGGKYFEPVEENPMIGLRGASRYYSDFYRDGFALECEAMKKVRDEKGLTNVKLMIPFCRTIEEGKNVLDEMAVNGLRRGENGLEVYVMIEIPSNVLLADEFAKLFDGFSIGSNDLTQLTLGLDRDSALISYLFNEENPAVKALIRETIRAAKRNNIKVGLCGQAPSDLPSFARFLVEEGIDSISFNPDAMLKGIENIVQSEKELKIHP